MSNVELTGSPASGESELNAGLADPPANLWPDDDRTLLELLDQEPWDEEDDLVHKAAIEEIKRLRKLLEAANII